MDDLAKLKHLLEHWTEHNDAHVQTYEEWASKAESLGRKDIAELLNRIVAESRKLNDLFTKAQEVI